MVACVIRIGRHFWVGFQSERCQFHSMNPFKMLPIVIPWLEFPITHNAVVIRILLIRESVGRYWLPSEHSFMIFSLKVILISHFATQNLVTHSAVEPWVTFVGRVTYHNPFSFIRLINQSYYYCKPFPFPRLESWLLRFASFSSTFTLRTTNEVARDSRWLGLVSINFVFCSSLLINISARWAFPLHVADLVFLAVSFNCLWFKFEE